MHVIGIKIGTPFVVSFILLTVSGIIAIPCVFFYDEGTMSNEILGRIANIIILVLSFPTLIWKIFINVETGAWALIGFFINITISSLLVQKFYEYFRKTMSL